MNCKGKLASRLARLLIVSGLLTALLCVAAANSVEHFHRDAESAATCRICQIAHIPLTPLTARVTLPVPVSTNAGRPLASTTLYFSPQVSQSQSRAPPAA